MTCICLKSGNHIEKGTRVHLASSHLWLHPAEERGVAAGALWAQQHHAVNLGTKTGTAPSSKL